MQKIPIDIIIILWSQLSAIGLASIFPKKSKDVNFTTHLITGKINAKL